MYELLQGDAGSVAECGLEIGIPVSELSCVSRKACKKYPTPWEVLYGAPAETKPAGSGAPYKQVAISLFMNGLGENSRLGAG